MKETTIGYIQLIDKNGKVLRQLPRSNNDPKLLKIYELSFEVEKHEGYKVIFTPTSNLAQPYHFFAPIDRDAIVTVYDTLEMGENKTPPATSDHKVQMSACMLELMERNNPTSEMPEWNAFIGDEWVGTSEF